MLVQISAGVTTELPVSFAGTLIIVAAARLSGTEMFPNYSTSRRL
jgi:hypothetical protein